MYNSTNPSSTFKKLENYYRKIHDEGVQGEDPKLIYDGLSTVIFADLIKIIIKKNSLSTLLDYGSGKGNRYYNKSIYGKKMYPPLKDYWKIKPTLFDPGVPYKKPKNKIFDIVISIDVLEHIPFQDLNWVIEEIFSFAKKIVFLNIACYPANKLLPNGQNAHVSIFPPLWWCGFISSIAGKYKKKCFLVCTFIENEKKKYLYHAINDRFENYK